MSHPLLRVVCCYGVGVAVGMWLGLAVFPSFLFFAGLLLVMALWARARTVLFPLFLASAGCLNLGVREAILSPDDIRLVTPEEPVLADARGRLVGPPKLTTFVRDGENQFRTMALLRLESVQLEGEWQPASGRIALSATGVAGDELHQGRRIEVSGVLRRPDGPLAQGLFDYRRHLAMRGIHRQMFTGGVGEWTVLDVEPCAPPFTERFIRWARSTLSRGLPSEDPATGLIQAMALGWKTALTGEIEQTFMKSGTMHIFAISGLHVALVAGMLLALLRLVRLPRELCGLLAISALWFYTAATGWQSSAIRATIMMTIILGGWTLKRPSNLLNSLAAAALVILLLEPHQLFQASFQLSFAVVLSLALILPPLQERVLRQLEPDPLLPRDLVPRWKRWMGKPLKWVALSAATSLAAWTGSMPLTAEYFHLFSPGTLLANLLLVPCASAALAGAMASLACGAWSPWLSEVFNHAAWFCMQVMMRISAGVSSLPGSHVYVPSPSGLALTVYYGTLLMLAFGWVRGRVLRWFLPGAALVLAGSLGWQAHGMWREASLTVLPLQGGMSVRIKAPWTFETVLVDCGSEHAARATLVPWLRAHGVNRVRTLFLTHGDTRHVGGAPLLMETFAVDELAVSPVSFRSVVYRRIVTGGLPGRTRIERVAAGDTRGVIEVLHPPAGLKVTRADDGVMILRVTLNQTTVLLCSDASPTAQRALLELDATAGLGADIVVTGLPDRGQPLVPEFLEAVTPKLIIIADADRPSSRRAPPELLERLQRGPAPVVSTRHMGAVKVTAHRHGWQANGVASK